MGYEVFQRRVRRVGTPSITLNRVGRIALNKAASDKFRAQAVDFVVLLWDAPSKKFAVKAVAKKDPRAYEVHYSKRDSGGGFSAVTFMEHIGFDYKAGSKQFPAVWNEDQGMFEVSMGDAEDASDAPLLHAVGLGGKRKDRR